MTVAAAAWVALPPMQVCTWILCRRFIPNFPKSRWWALGDACCMQLAVNMVAGSRSSKLSAALGLCI